MRRRTVLALGGSILLLSGCFGRDTDGINNASTGENEPEKSSHSGEQPIESSEWPTGTYEDYDTVPITVRSPDRTVLGTITAAIARTRTQRYLGLSDASNLPENGGLLFVFDSPDERTFVMRGMDFGIDIIFADETQKITSIHHAPIPTSGVDTIRQRYTGSGMFVLEVNYEWTTRHGIAEGDMLDFDL